MLFFAPTAGGGCWGVYFNAFNEDDLFKIKHHVFGFKQVFIFKHLFGGNKKYVVF